MITINHPTPSLATHRFAKARSKKILFHRELADLGVQFLDLGSGIFFHGRRFPGKGRHHAFFGLTLPARDHRLVYVVLAGQLAQGQLAGQGFKRPPWP
jgi:hypothetical protein